MIFSLSEILCLEAGGSFDSQKRYNFDSEFVNIPLFMAIFRFL